MTQFENAPELNSSLDWCYFDALFNNYGRFAPAHIFIVDAAEPISSIENIVSMTKFYGFGIAEWWLYILEKELLKQLAPTFWLKQANVWLDRRAAAWANQTPEVRQILQTTIKNSTIEDKDALKRPLYQEFPSDQNNVMTEE